MTFVVMLSVLTGFSQQIKLGTYNILNSPFEVHWLPKDESYIIDIVGFRGEYITEDNSQLMKMVVVDPKEFRDYLDWTLEQYRDHQRGVKIDWNRYKYVLLRWRTLEGYADHTISVVEPTTLSMEDRDVLVWFDGVSSVESRSKDTIKPIMVFDGIENLEQFVFLFSEEHLKSTLAEIEEIEEAH